MPSVERSFTANPYLTGINSQWYLDLDNGAISGYFQGVSGLLTESPPIQFKDTGKGPTNPNTGRAGALVNVYRLPGDPVYSSIILRRGLNCSMALYEWRRNIEQFGLKDGAGATFKKQGSLMLLSTDGTEKIAQYDIGGAWPCRLRGPSLSTGHVAGASASGGGSGGASGSGHVVSHASNSSTIAVEEVELWIDTLVRVYQAPAGAARS